MPAGAVPAIVLISEDLDELLRLSDRIAVMHRGRAERRLPTSGVTVRELGLLMTGQAAAMRLEPRAASAGLAASPRRRVARRGAGAWRWPRCRWRWPVPTCRRLPADGRGEPGLALRAERDPDPRHALDPHRARRRGRVPRPALEHRRRGPALPRCGGRGGARHRCRARCRPRCCCPLVARRRRRGRRPAHAGADLAQAAARRRRGGDHAAAQLRGAAVRRHAARRARCRTR